MYEKEDSIAIPLDFDLNTKKMKELVKQGIAKPGDVDGVKGYFIDKQWAFYKGMILTLWTHDRGYIKPKDKYPLLFISEILFLSGNIFKCSHTLNVNRSYYSTVFKEK